MKEHPDTNVVEMDCVEGKKGGSRVILTFTLRNYHLMFMVHLEYQDQECVLKVFVWLKTVHRKQPLKLFIRYPHGWRFRILCPERDGDIFPSSKATDGKCPYHISEILLLNFTFNCSITCSERTCLAPITIIPCSLPLQASTSGRSNKIPSFSYSKLVNKRNMSPSLSSYQMVAFASLTCQII